MTMTATKPVSCQLDKSYYYTQIYIMTTMCHNGIWATATTKPVRVLFP